MKETMQEMMEREKAEAIATLMRANSALSRIFGIKEVGEDNERDRKVHTESKDGA
jgi:hypothetical protein